MSRFRALALLTVVSVVVVCPVAAQPVTFLSTDGTPIPDVNKANPADPNDGSCWLASAANILAAAGYGSGGAAQQRANSIYAQLTAAYGTAGGGAPDQAISFWLAQYGKNPDSPEYQPANPYTDVTARYSALGASDYTFLQNELSRGQYVGVQFQNPAHAMTLVGWDTSQNASLWTDSDRGNGTIDAYTNVFQASPVDWDLYDPMAGANYLNNANGYVTFCPGLDKNPDYVANYDVAWAPGPQGPAAREAGAMVGVYDPVPGWMGQWTDPQDPSAVFDVFGVDNEPDFARQKHIELLVDYYGHDTSYLNEDIRLRYVDESGQVVVALPTSKTLSADHGQVLFTWELDIQPESEEILFPGQVGIPNLDYRMLEGKVASWDCAMVCVPEPASLVCLTLGAAALVRRRRFARKG